MRSSGFSLIELVIVVAIIGLIGSVAVPKFSAIQNKAKNTTLKATVHTIEMALETYHLDHGDYPAGENMDAAALSTILVQLGLLPAVPENPFTGKVFAASDTKGRVLYSQNGFGYTMTVYGSGESPIASLVR